MKAASTADTRPAFDELLETRHSCRGFTAQEVPRSTIERMLLTAQRTASWCNAQPWQVFIVSGAPLEALRRQLVQASLDRKPACPDIAWPREYVGIYQARRRECGWALYEAVGVSKGDRSASEIQARENFRLFGAPHLAVVCSNAALGTYGVMDCGAWIQNFLLAATSQGVASVAQAALATWPDILRKHLPIPGDLQVVAGVSFGYEDTEHRANRFRTNRAALHESVVWVD